MRHQAQKQTNRAAPAPTAKKKSRTQNKASAKTPKYLQTKLKISKPADPHEQEAEQVADNVMRMPVQRNAKDGDTQLNRASLSQSDITPINRSISRLINRAAVKPGEQTLQRKSDQTNTTSPDNIESRINVAKAGGDKLPDGIRSEMEGRFSRDFSAVRIHVDQEANTLNREINARAFTLGNNIFFAEGEFSPHSDTGKHLLAHELTHVVQQQNSPRHASSTQEVTRSEEKIQRWGFGSITSWLADKAWDILEEVAPAELYNLVKDISSKGIFGYLKEIITDAAGAIFDGLKQGADVLSGFFASFGDLAKTAKTIIKALIGGDCKPLFAAVKQLKDTLGAAAGEAWNAITEFFSPIGTFFTNLWKSWGAPVLDWLKATAGDAWTYIKDLGNTIWEWTQPVRDYASSAWNWLKDKLGLSGGSEGGSSGGLMGWVKAKAQSAWDSVKSTLDPVIQPILKIKDKIAEILPLKAILNLRETVQGWLTSAEAMGQAMGDDGEDVANQQISLREQILPAVINTILSVRESLNSAGLWIGTQVSSLASLFAGFMARLRSNSLLSHVATLLSWIESAVTSIWTWYADTVKSLLSWLGDGLVHLARFIEPVLNVLQKIADTVTNLLGKLPDLILGPLWNAIPKCIRDPLKDFVLNQILGRLPFFKQLLGMQDAWEQIKATALLILKQVFVDGNLFGALWTLFKSILSIFGLPAKLITNIIIKGAQSLGAIIAAPLDFLINILGAVKLGFSNFFGNILTHLMNGVANWLFGSIAKAGLSMPKDFSLKSIFGFILDILGLTMELVWKKLAEKIGQKKVDKFKGMLAKASGALEWIKIAVSEGPASLWEKLKEKLSDLWMMLIQGVVTWVNLKIMGWASRWLVSLLDVSGIMPTINAIIAIYKAIESFMEQLRAMLEILNKILNGIADLAAGAIESAAGYLEGALADSVPVVISFLANQAGLGGIADKIGEILASIRLKVEEAIAWLVGQVVDRVTAFVDKVKDGAAAVREWWKKKKAFNTESGESHTLYTSGSATSLTFMLASKPTTYRAFLGKISIKNDDPNKDKKKKAQSEAKKLFAELEALVKTKTSQGKDEINTTDFDEKLTALAQHTAVLMEGASTIPLSTPPVYGGLTSAGYASSMFAPRLTKKGASCQSGTSPPSVPNGEHYNRLNARKTPSGKGSFYIKGHLLNDNIHGPGTTWSNLTPLTRWTNNNDSDSHLNAVEKFVKEEVCDRERIVEYKIQAVYDRTVKTDLITQLDQGNDPQKEVKKDIIREEALIPSKLIANASIVGVTNDADTLAVPKQFIAAKVVNNSARIDTPLSEYYVDGEAEQKKTLQHLGVNEELGRADKTVAEKAFMSISGIGGGTVNLLTASAKNAPFTSWESMQKALQAQALLVNDGNTANASRSATGIINLLKQNTQVSLDGKTEWK